MKQRDFIASLSKAQRPYLRIYFIAAAYIPQGKPQLFGGKHVFNQAYWKSL